jgi:hypothetical protein
MLAGLYEGPESIAHLPLTSIGHSLMFICGDPVRRSLDEGGSKGDMT